MTRSGEILLFSIVNYNKRMAKNELHDKNSRIMNMVVILVWLVVFMIIILGIFFPVVSFISLKEVYLKDQAVAAHFSSQFVSEFFNFNQSVVSASAEMDFLQDVSFYDQVKSEYRGIPEKSALVQRRYFANILDHNASFRFFALLTPDSVRPIFLQPYSAQLDLSREQYERGYAYREWAQKTIKNYQNWNKKELVPCYVSNVFISQPGNIPAVSISVPVISKQKEMIGILYANISLAILSEFIKNMSFGKTGKIYIVDDDGNLLAHPDIAPGEEAMNIYGKKILLLRNMRDIPMVANSLKGRFIPGLYRLSESHKLVLSSYERIPTLGWTVVVEQEAGEAFSIILIYAYVIIFIVFLTIIVSLIAFLFISRETAENNRRHRELLIISETDPLTGLLNRRSMISRMNQLLSDYEQNGQSFVIAMFDIDDFKQVNDSFGHVFGDAVLREIAARTVSILRVEDLLFRWGGEEFLLVIKNCDLRRGRGIAEKIRRVVNDTPINDGTMQVSVTITIGVCQYHGGSIDSCIIHADEALYEGKRAGKNMIIVSHE